MMIDHLTQTRDTEPVAVRCPTCASDAVTVVEVTYRRYMEVIYDAAANTYVLDPAGSLIDAPGSGHAQEFECGACEHSWVSDSVGFSLLPVEPAPGRSALVACIRRSCRHAVRVAAEAVVVAGKRVGLRRRRR
ncbi:hypothetical protein GCM10022226_61760 [Sphaerisporangium flaviroseum]|uniref:Uncharacterized protein n=1 Tax=Sphaerisporangium flaviroseum TaxID=509199 RepID=A0ABP7J2B0_9ACTN